MPSRLLRFADEPSSKTIGGFVLCFLLGFAVGQAHANHDALEGAAKWWQHDEQKKISEHIKHDQEMQNRLLTLTAKNPNQ